jgi:alkylation response protein AidB-like acyl-CoA dehydrogenase
MPTIAADKLCEVRFKDVNVPKKNVLGKIDEGWPIVEMMLRKGAIAKCAESLGAIETCVEMTVAYSKERQQFNKPISSYQAIAFKLADMATEIEASKLLIDQAAEMKNNGQSVNKTAAMAKYYASEVCVRVANEAVQIFGGYGFTKDFPVEKFYRDCKLCTIGEGTSEIQKLVISRHILK